MAVFDSLQIPSGCVHGAQAFPGSRYGLNHVPEEMLPLVASKSGHETNSELVTFLTKRQACRGRASVLGTPPKEDLDLHDLSIAHRDELSIAVALSAL